MPLLIDDLPDRLSMTVVETKDAEVTIDETDKAVTVFSPELDQPSMVALAESAGSPEPPPVGWLGD